MIYLASKSARRTEILKRMKVAFRVVESNYHEHFLEYLSPSELVIKHAIGKALKARLPRGARYVLSADTIVWRNKFYGKPRTLRGAVKMLKELSGKTHEVYTGVVIWDRRQGLFYQGVSKTRVRFKKLTDAWIRDYLKVVYPLDKAGAYAIQEGPRIVKSIRGSYSNVVGLPKELVRKLLKKCFKRPMLKGRII